MLKKWWIGFAVLGLISGLGVGTYYAARYVFDGSDSNFRDKMFSSWGDDVFSNKKLTQLEIDDLIAEYKPTSLDGLNEVAKNYEEMFQNTKKEYLQIKFWEGLDDYPTDDEIKVRATTMTESYLEYRFFKFLNASFVWSIFSELNKDLDIDDLPAKINSKNQYDDFLKLYQAIFNIVDSAASINNMLNSKQYTNLINQSDEADKQIYYNRKDNLVLFINSLNSIKFRDVIGNLFNLSILLLEYAKNNDLNLNLSTIVDEDELNKILETDKTQLKALDFDSAPAIEFSSNEPDKIDLKQVNSLISEIISKRIAELNKISWDKIDRGDYDDTIETWGFKNTPLTSSKDYKISQVTLDDLGKSQTDWEWNETFEVNLKAEEKSQFCEGTLKISFNLKVPTFLF